MTTVLSTECDPSQASVNVSEYIKVSPTVDNIKNKNVNLKKQIKDIKEIIDLVKNNIHTKDGDVQDEKIRNTQQYFLIKELTDNINEIVNNNCRIKEWINYTRGRVIVDHDYLNFEERATNYYVRQTPETEDFKMGDLYINVNQRVEATNGIYVNIRPTGTTNRYSANDRQEMYDSQKESVLSILGIDPIDVTHPYRSERTVDINPEKLGVFIENLKQLDLTHVEVTVNEIYYNPVFHEDVHFEKNVDVKFDVTVPELEADDGEFEQLEVHNICDCQYGGKACIEELTCDTKVTGDRHVKNDMKVSSSVKLDGEIRTHNMKITDTVEFKEGELIYIGDQKKRFADRFRDTVLELDIPLCCCCPPPPPKIPTEVPSCDTCKDVKICKQASIIFYGGCDCSFDQQMQGPFSPCKTWTLPPQQIFYQYKANNPESQTRADVQTQQQMAAFNAAKAQANQFMSCCKSCRNKVAITERYNVA